ncbi:MAG TPA: tripartite tricarboxylate transporter TctB family protein [Thermodesulfobacteriota bacterium]
MLLAAAYLGMALQMPFGRLSQPGAAVFPLIVGGLLVVGSLATIWEGWKTGPAERVEFPAGADRARLLGVVGLLLGYFVALPWLGQLLSSTLFCILLMRLLSSLAWPRVALYSILITGTLYAVFIHLLGVPMPRGVLAG